MGRKGSMRDPIKHKRRTKHIKVVTKVKIEVVKPAQEAPKGPDGKAE